jgi:hypothetical protein
VTGRGYSGQVRFSFTAALRLFLVALRTTGFQSYSSESTITSAPLFLFKGFLMTVFNATFLLSVLNNQITQNKTLFEHCNFNLDFSLVNIFPASGGFQFARQAAPLTTSKLMHLLRLMI